MLAVAAGTRSWELARYGDFLSGTFENVELDREGTLRVAPALTEVYASDQAVIWSLAKAEDGTVYFGTGHQGGVYRVRSDGVGELLWRAPEIEVFALAVGQDGLLYAATSPNGRVYRISADGEGAVFFDPEDPYIWSLLFDLDGRLIVGTGSHGKVYRVTPKGEASLWFESGQRHVMSLALDAAGRVLAGTDPDGVLYRINDDGGAFALHDSDLPEVRSIAVDPAGVIYFAAMGGGMDRLLQSIPAAGAGVLAPASAPAAQASVQVASSQVTSSVTYAQQSQVVYQGERAALMRVVDGRAVEKLWSSNEENILGVEVEHTSPARVLFATDQEGRIFRMGDDRSLSLVSQTGQAQMTALLRARDGVFVASAHGGSLYLLGRGPAAHGVYATSPRDAGGVAQWGALSWRGEVTEGSSIEIRTRSGNTYRPDASWSTWSEPLPNSSGSAVQSPSARFLQWQATLRGDSQLDSVRVHYLPQNSAPVVRSVNVVPESTSGESSSTSQTANSSSGYSITVSASGDSSPPQPTSGNSGGSAPVRRLAIVWGAEDPDRDELRAEVSFRGEGETIWKVVETDLPGPRYSVEGDTLADGWYEFRVRVDDGKANPEGRVLHAERISRPVLVDQTPPVVRGLTPAADGSLRFEAQDAASEIRSAEFAINAGEWKPVFSDDGVLDGRLERFTLPTGNLGRGEHLVVLRVRDRAGNAALAKSLVR